MSVFAFAELQDPAVFTLVSVVVTGSHAGNQLTRFWVDYIMDPTPFTFDFHFQIGVLELPS